MTRTADSGRAGRRPALTRARIVHAAIGLIEREGADALSMRRVAGELGVAVMSLYNHVPNKDALLQGVAEHIVAGMDLDCSPDEPWTGRARALVRAFRKVAHDHPRCMNVVFTHRIGTSAGLRPAERALALAESAGFDGETSVRIMRALLAYALGAQLREIGAVRKFDRLPGDGAEEFARLDPDEFPHVIALAPQLARHDPETDFEFGLDLLVNALESLPRSR
ncbi:TetR/AcrR family transcriptional regulator [Actinomadura xylanilytica]|uniref:TetR/AcrR family transcriptional regulator n=1 Tax=Actinomadura xylanilytica TaxID=887459 RepID=UPI00255AE8CC|nr:TetR/AcrR family transcriptional regulator C-terminal domain-containing protein [Actinomadura xylanilytica]MDL4775602.1 TetR/AcrR family transcriptional regulator C-terminal domain-containing protein [Actinomadura xylanilytica]